MHDQHCPVSVQVDTATGHFAICGPYCYHTGHMALQCIVAACIAHAAGAEETWIRPAAADCAYASLRGFLDGATPCKPAQQSSLNSAYTTLKLQQKPTARNGLASAHHHQKPPVPSIVKLASGALLSRALFSTFQGPCGSRQSRA